MGDNEPYTSGPHLCVCAVTVKYGLDYLRDAARHHSRIYVVVHFFADLSPNSHEIMQALFSGSGTITL